MQVDAQAGIIPGQYIVVYNNDVVDVAGVTSAVSARAEANVRYTYDRVLKGFAGEMSAEAAAALAQDPRVKYVVPDGIATITQSQSPVTWGLDRVDQRVLPLSGSFGYTTSRTVVHAYIIDTGILTAHAEFGGPNNTRRTGAGFDAVTIGGNAEDCNGHGTHVAGTIAGTTYGVAKNAVVHPVRVLSCGGSGTWSGVINGMNWVAANAIKPAVANMSLGGGFNQAVNEAATALAASGVFVGVAAGNDNLDACNFSPASASGVTSVGSTTSTDARSSFSNTGTCVTLFAPGSSITSAWWTSPTAVATISGTSMATPHVVGVAALYKARRGDASQTVVQNWMLANATQNVVTNPGAGSANLLVYSPF
jgi:subtilisin family serine protease